MTGAASEVLDVKTWHEFILAHREPEARVGQVRWQALGRLGRGRAKNFAEQRPWGKKTTTSE